MTKILLEYYALMLKELGIEYEINKKGEIFAKVESYEDGYTYQTLTIGNWGLKGIRARFVGIGQEVFDNQEPALMIDKFNSEKIAFFSKD